MKRYIGAIPETKVYLLRSDTSNWLWNVSSHITAILMSWPAESIVEDFTFYLHLSPIFIDELMKIILQIHPEKTMSSRNNEEGERKKCRVACASSRALSASDHSRTLVYSLRIPGRVESHLMERR